jgi:hypothetical protein
LASDLHSSPRPKTKGRGHKRYSPTHDDHVLTAVPWADGNDKRDAYVELDQPVNPNKDKRIPGGFYAIMPSALDAAPTRSPIDGATRAYSLSRG